MLIVHHDPVREGAPARKKNLVSQCALAAAALGLGEAGGGSGQRWPYISCNFFDHLRVSTDSDVLSTKTVMYFSGMRVRVTRATTLPFWILIEYGGSGIPAIRGKNS